MAATISAIPRPGRTWRSPPDTGLPVGAEHTFSCTIRGASIDQRFRDPNNGLATLDEGDFFNTGGTSNVLNISYYTKSDDNDVTLTHPGRYDFNGFGGHTATELLRAHVAVPIQGRNAAGWVGTLPWYFERVSASDPGWDRLRYDGQSTNPMGDPLMFQVDVVASKTYEVMILTGDTIWNHDQESFRCTRDGAAESRPRRRCRDTQIVDCGAPGRRTAAACKSPGAAARPTRVRAITAGYAYHDDRRRQRRHGHVMMKMEDLGGSTARR